jgi:hypothetical protein
MTDLDDVAEPEALVGKDELDEDDEMELSGNDLLEHDAVAAVEPGSDADRDEA